MPPLGVNSFTIPEALVTLDNSNFCVERKYVYLTAAAFFQVGLILLSNPTIGAMCLAEY
jgi:hypothetical protein